MDLLTAMNVFARVAEHASFTAAAERLDITRGMATRHVAQLERHLGARLLDRTTRRVSLTEAGAAYLERCRQVLTDIEEAEALVCGDTAHPRGTLRITAALSFGLRYLAPAIGEFLCRHPDVAVDLSFNDRVVDLVEEGFDLAIRIGDPGPASLTARRIASSGLQVCAAPAYWQQHGRPRTPAGLRTHATLLYSHGSAANEWQFSDARGEPHVVKLGTRLRANNGDALVAAATAGLGVVLQPDFIVADTIARGDLEAVLQDYRAPTLGVYAVFPTRRLVSAKVRVFVEFLAGRFRDPPWTTAAAQGSGAAPPGR